jgi:hypothetical protein
MDHAVGSGSAAAQTFQIFKRTTMHLSARGGQRLGAGIGSGQAEHLMSRF